MSEPILRVGTFNIRFDLGSPTQGETPWNVRRVKVVDTILFHKIDLVGIQVKHRLYFYFLIICS